VLTVKELLEREDFLDAALLRHGFTDYMRDYEIIVSGRDGPPRTDVHRYLFIGCAEAVYQTAVSSEYFGPSLPDEFVLAGPDNPEEEIPDGFIWGVRWACAYPGLTYRRDGERARYWEGLLQRPMHEVFLETNAYSLLLVFADVRHSYIGVANEPGVLREKDYPTARCPPISHRTAESVELEVLTVGAHEHPRAEAS
jgi:hypothetical protein